MEAFTKKKVMTDRQKQIDRLKQEIRNCERLMRRTEAMFHMTVDDNLIEARIYEMKSLAKHHDYLISTLRSLVYTEADDTAAVSV